MRRSHVNERRALGGSALLPPGPALASASGLNFLDDWGDAVTNLVGASPPGGYPTPHRRLSLLVDGTTIQVGATPTTWVDVGVWVNGVFNQVVTYSGTTGVLEVKSVTLPAGSDKVVDLVESAGGANGSVCIISSVSGHKAQVTPTITKQHVLVGDSIGIGVGGTPSSMFGFHVQVRYGLPAGWCSACYSAVGQQLQSLVLNQARKDTLVARLGGLLKGTSKNIVQLQDGTNDWAAGRSKAQYKADCITFRNLIASSFPSVPGLAFVFTSPTPRNAETTPNGAGATLQDMRDGMSEAAASFGDTYNDGGTMWLNPAENATYLSADGLHPNNGGHTKIATRALTVLGGF